MIFINNETLFVKKKSVGKTLVNDLLKENFICFYQCNILASIRQSPTKKYTCIHFLYKVISFDFLTNF